MKFFDFKSKLLNRFSFTKPAHLRGLPKNGIGVMESQHRKITYRMKHQDEASRNVLECFRGRYNGQNDYFRTS